MAAGERGHDLFASTGAEDDGDVHINSGIPNHAFYLAAMALGGFAWEKAGRIWYIARRGRLRRTDAETDHRPFPVLVALPIPSSPAVHQ
jgi:Zn-dependent metalloprotease